MEYTNEEILSELFKRIDERFKVLESRIEKPKKLVTREAITPVKSWSNFGDPDVERYTFKVPVGAKNVHCTYEIEE